jgi:hypothetical protein
MTSAYYPPTIPAYYPPTPPTVPPAYSLPTLSGVGGARLLSRWRAGIGTSFSSLVCG